MDDQKLTKKELLAKVSKLRRRIAAFESGKNADPGCDKAIENHYKSVFENTGTATMIIEADMTVSMVNARFESLSGYTKEEIEWKMKWTDFVVDQDLKRMKRYHVKRRLDPTAAPREYECRVVNRFSEIRDMNITIDMIPGMGKSVASFMDVTSFKQAEAALKESERRLNNLMGHLPGMAYRCRIDDERTMIFVSRGCRGLTGYAPVDIVKSKKLSYGALIHPDDLKRVLATVSDGLNEAAPFQIEYRIVTASGKIRWVWEEGIGIVSPIGKLMEVEGFVSDITAHKKEEQQLRKENISLKTTIRERFRFGDIIGKNPAMQEVYGLISKAAATDANIIIYGESGTGKELVARAIHNVSDNAEMPFVAVNCSAVPEHLFESEFFGYKKGAFTGAVGDKSGYFDRATGGTLFLDELGEIDINAQAKLLRVIEGGGYTPVGGSQVRQARVRIIGATNRNLKEEVKNGRMREDFFYRIHVIPITLPPLRARKDDLPLLIDHFMELYAGKDRSQITGRVVNLLYNYDWPGNVRELQNVLQRYITLKTLDFMPPGESGPGALPEDIPITGFKSLGYAMALYEKRLITGALDKNRWQKQKAAQALDINRKTLFRKMKRHGLI
ncbi:MAG: PAS domain S-box protein [Deltaproteobacteria bacterium]|nr:PAS domain S-box protein [Deltaproteobacteria bacterium]